LRSNYEVRTRIFIPKPPRSAEGHFKDEKLGTQPEDSTTKINLLYN
jgi:hypothetical protein